MFKEELKSENHTFLVFIFSKFKRYKSSFGSCFCPLLLFLRNKTRTGNEIVRIDSADIKSCFI